MKLHTLFIFCLLMTGCACLEQYSLFNNDAFKNNKIEYRNQLVAKYCNATGAYNAGYREGTLPHKNPQRGFADYCPHDQTLLNDAYLTGYTQGLKERALKYGSIQ